MRAPRTVERNVLLALYHHAMLTAGQLRILLNYEPFSMYRVLGQMRREDWIQGMPLKFLTGNVKGWALTKDGFNVAYGLSEEADPKYPRNKGAFPGQAEHLFGTNQFFISLISASMDYPGEGLIEWLGVRGAADNFAIETKGKRTTPLRPDGEGIYRFSDGKHVELLFEYDTGTEHTRMIQDKLKNYGDHIWNLWQEKAGLVNVLFVTRTSHRALKIRAWWNWYLKEWFRNRKVPTLWFTHEKALNEQGVLGPIWLNSEGQLMSMQQFPRIENRLYSAGIPLGKQANKSSPYANSQVRRP